MIKLRLTPRSCLVFTLNNLAYRFPLSLLHAFKLSFVWGEQACSLSPLTTDGRHFFFFFLSCFHMGGLQRCCEKTWLPNYMCTREYRHADGLSFLFFSLVLDFAHYVQIVLHTYFFFAHVFFFLHFRFNNLIGLVLNKL